MGTEREPENAAGTRPPRPLARQAPAATSPIPKQLKVHLNNTSIPMGYTNPHPISPEEVGNRAEELHLKPTVPLDQIVNSVNRIKPASIIETRMPAEIKASIAALRPQTRRFHGAKLALSYFSFPGVSSACADRFGYMSSSTIRSETSLPFNAANQALLNQLGDLMGELERDPNPESHNSRSAGVSTIPAGFTYFGQFVDHDITFDVSSSLDVAMNANDINNMRTPSLDLDSLYGRGPGLDPFLYRFPTSAEAAAGVPDSAIKLALGTNTIALDTGIPLGPGGPSSTGARDGMEVQTTFDVPRMASSLTAVIGDPRNDENLLVVQLHHAMLRFHNAVIDLLLLAGFTGDLFSEAKRIVTQHYQWAVVHDFLKRICGEAAINDAMATVSAPIGSSFRMPVEFSVAAYRFGHSMIRDRYFVNFNFPEASLDQVFEFNRVPRLPVFSNWVVDFNAYFETGHPTGTHNKARRIDSILANGLETLPGTDTLPAVLKQLAMRNLRRGLALGLPSGQGMAKAFGIPALTTAQLSTGLPANEVTLLNSGGGVLLKHTPLWYYILREAAVLRGGNQLGPVGGRIVAETFVRILKRDAASYLNVSGGFAPMLPSATPGDFTVADLLNFAGVTQP